MLGPKRWDYLLRAGIILIRFLLPKRNPPSSRMKRGGGGNEGIRVERGVERERELTGEDTTLEMEAERGDGTDHTLGLGHGFG